MHITDKGGIYHKLGEKIDNLHVKAPWNETWHRASLRSFILLMRLM